MCGKSQQQKSSNSEKIIEFLENRESLETFFLLPQIHLIKRFSPHRDSISIMRKIPAIKLPRRQSKYF
jgi:hypothetical protein